MPKPFDVAAAGEIAYQYIEIPTNFTEDKYIQLAEARPGNRRIVHHIIAFVQPPAKADNPASRLSPEERRKMQPA